MGERSPALISVTRTIVPLGSGGVTSERSVGSGSVAATGAGVARVFQSSWKTAEPTSCERGAGPSESTTERPAASWPVTTRRGGATLFLAELPAAGEELPRDPQRRGRAPPRGPGPPGAEVTRRAPPAEGVR